MDQAEMPCECVKSEADALDSALTGRSEVAPLTSALPCSMIAQAAASKSQAVF